MKHSFPWATIRDSIRTQRREPQRREICDRFAGTQEFARLRLGCGPDHPLNSRKEYVLRPMKRAELEIARR